MRRSHPLHRLATLRWSVILALALAGALAGSVVGSVPASGGQKTAPRFTDGAWTGDVIYAVSATFPGNVAAQAVLETAIFDLQVTGGSVSGVLHGTGEGMAFAGADAGTVLISFDADVSGDAGGPLLTPTRFAMSGTAIVQGISVPIDVNLDAAAGPTAILEISKASCDAASGSFEQQVAAMIASAGGTPTSLSAYWFATRQSESSGSVSDALAELTTAASEILQSFQQDGVFDPAALFQLVKSAESFSANLKKNTACGLVEDPNTFSTAITGVVTQMLTLAFGPYADKFTPAQLADLIYAGIATGALGSGAADAAKATALEAAAKTQMQLRLQDAISNGFKSFIEDILEVAIAMGWSDVAADASTALAKFK